ncbi:hypothetical protein [Clostridium sp. JS66]|uniref:hypothetical protein n=1 Tax=Clostridium sp. JS66 TaxID=3064705 RepID=UPI00298DAA11|nr:hypothetical protein [Clostridium sp. JS66]WPC42930.1 hypothetical protein Q6H37_05515 [Clostridium sp. JS66]
MDNNFWVEVDKKWFYAPEGEETLIQKYGTLGFVIYSILLRSVTTRNTIPICVNSIADILLINKKNNNRFVNRIKNKIKDMNNNLFILCKDTNCNIPVEDINNSTIYFTKLNDNKDAPFMMLYDNEIDKLIEYSVGKNVSVEDLITHYSFIVNGFKGKKEKEEVPEGYKCWYGTFDSITNKIGLAKNTLVANNKIFQELNLLLIGNAGGKLDKENNTYENTSNIYSKFADKEYFNKYLEVKKGQINKSFQRNKDKKEQDEQRRLKQIYKNYQKKNNITCIEDIEDKEKFRELNSLELNYYNFVKMRDKDYKIRKSNFITIRTDGIIKENDFNISNVSPVEVADNWGEEEPKTDIDDMDNISDEEVVKAALEANKYNSDDYGDLEELEDEEITPQSYGQQDAVPIENKPKNKLYDNDVIKKQKSLDAMMSGKREKVIWYSKN